MSLRLCLIAALASAAISPASAQVLYTNRSPPQRRHRLRRFLQLQRPSGRQLQRPHRHQLLRRRARHGRRLGHQRIHQERHRGVRGRQSRCAGDSQTADQVVDEVRILGGVGCGKSYFDPAAFIPVTAVRFGNSGRNILRRPVR